MGKSILGAVMLVGGILFGAFMGLWVCFIGGILDIVEFVVDLTKGQEGSLVLVGWGVLKIMLAGFVGWLSASILVIPSTILLGWKD